MAISSHISKGIRSRIRSFERYATLNNAVLAIAVFIALGWVWGTVDALGRNYKYQQQVDTARAQNELLSLQTDNLQAEQAYLNTNEYLELAAREKLNKAMPGEKLLILPKSQGGTTASRAISAPAPSNVSQWVTFLLGSHNS
jgi:cell division protein FtsB